MSDNNNKILLSVEQLPNGELSVKLNLDDQPTIEQIGLLFDMKDKLYAIYMAELERLGATLLAD